MKGKKQLQKCASFTITFLMVACLVSCKKSQEIPVADLTGAAYSYYEDVTGGSISIPVTLSGTYDKTVSIAYTTSDSTAIGGTDYQSASGTVTFNPGKKSASITLYIISDTAQKQDVTFKINFSDPVNCTLKGSMTPVKIRNTDYVNLVWSDEFSTPGALDPSVWNYEIGTGSNGWGNNELESYTNSLDNVHIDTGYLHITAIKGISPLYSSGRITTKGKKEFTHCRVNIRAQLPEGQGIWPALWMLGANISTVSWPACGEIDIMELLGQNPSTVYGTVHWNDNGHVMQGGSTSLSGGKFSNSFHIFSLIWGPNHFQWLIDNQPYLYINKSATPAFPFDLPQFFIFNVAVGGNWPQAPDGTTLFPQNMIVDYIRVYQ
jgi:beta-glucanase (GH16 family)